jgi:hypothetical protein
MNKKYFFLLTFLLVSAVVSAQDNKNLAISKAPNKCYGKAKFYEFENTHESDIEIGKDENEEEYRIGWVEVLCDSKIDEQIIKKVCEKLKEENLLDENHPPRMDRSFKKALSLYQKGHNLPVGHFNMTTLSLMNIF